MRVACEVMGVPLESAAGIGGGPREGLHIEPSDRKIALQPRRNTHVRGVNAGSSDDFMRTVWVSSSLFMIHDAAASTRLRVIPDPEPAAEAYE
jgi:hypothetical protein